MYKRLYKFFLKCQAFFLRNRIDRNKVIVRFDGGISSQIAFWALYLEFEKQGYEVSADLSWYRDDGMDMFGQHVRNFDMEKVFPGASINVAKPFEAYFYQHNFFVDEESFRLDLKPPAYLGGYYDRWSSFKKHAQEIARQFKPELPGDARLAEILDDIERADATCAVHVRRGDLAVFNPYYGEPLTADYFKEAIRKVATIKSSTVYYFFSDDMAWVKEELIKPLANEVECHAVDVNDSARGYLDLYLMSKCSSFVASQGSLAKYARLLGDESRLIIEPSSARLFDASDKHPSICI